MRFLLLGAAGVVLLNLAGVRVGSGGASSTPGPAVTGPAILVSTRPMNAGTVLTKRDAELRPVPGGMLVGSLTSATAIDGRRLLVGVQGGTPLLAPMLGPPGARPGLRTLVVVVDGEHLDPSLGPGADADVIAAVDGDNHAGAVSAVAVARVVAITAAADAASRPSGGHPAALVAVTLECEARDALRIVWAESYARTVRLLARDVDGGSALAAVDGLTG